MTDNEREAVERGCEVMHDAYERAAAEQGWETQERSRKPWSDVPEANKATMRAAVSALIEHLSPPATDEPTEADRARAEVQAAVVVVLENEPLLISAIRRDVERTPKRRGGVVDYSPGTDGYGKSGCPGDNLLTWPEELRKALTDTDTSALDRMLAEARADALRDAARWAEEADELPKLRWWLRQQCDGEAVLSQDEADRTIPFDCQMTSDCLCPPNATRRNCYAARVADGGEGR